MDIKIVINGKDVSKEDIRSFVQMIREWELRTPQAGIVGVLFDTDPQLTGEEAKSIFEGVFPQYKHMAEIPTGVPQLIRLGNRGVAIGGELIGTCEELSLSIGEATEEDIKKMEEAQTISLIRIPRG